MGWKGGGGGQVKGAQCIRAQLRYTCAIIHPSHQVLSDCTLPAALLLTCIPSRLLHHSHRHAAETWAALPPGA
jgi:hypothetical protein